VAGDRSIVGSRTQLIAETFTESIACATLVFSGVISTNDEQRNWLKMMHSVMPKLHWFDVVVAVVDLL